jgi:hypothetical protein
MVGRVVRLATSEQALADAAAAFPAQPSLARSTHRSYEQTLTRWSASLAATGRCRRSPSRGSRS